MFFFQDPVSLCFYNYYRKFAPKLTCVLDSFAASNCSLTPDGDGDGDAASYVARDLLQSEIDRLLYLVRYRADAADIFLSVVGGCFGEEVTPEALAGLAGGSGGCSVGEFVRARSGDDD